MRLGAVGVLKAALLAATVGLVLSGQVGRMQRLRAEISYRRASDLMKRTRSERAESFMQALGRAMGDLDAAVRLDPAQAQFHYRRGQLLHRLAKESRSRLKSGEPVSGTTSAELLRQAEQAFAQAVELSPNLPGYQVALGWARANRYLFAEQRFTPAEHVECVRTFERALQLAPNDAEVNFETGRYLLLASSVLDESLMTQAQTVLRRAAELDLRTLSKSLDCLWTGTHSVEALHSIVPETTGAQRVFAEFLKSCPAAARSGDGDGVEVVLKGAP